MESSRGERRERKNTRLLCWIAIGKRGMEIDSKDSKVLDRAAFHFLPSCSTSFHQVSTLQSKEGENRTPVEFLIPFEATLDASWIFLIIFDSLEMSAGQRDVNSSIFILRFDRLPFRIIHI